jgi:hypothetical protein
MKGWKFHYPDFFWEKENEYIKKLSPQEFREYLDELRCANDMKSKAKLREIIRKMVERGSCFEGTLFLLPEEVRDFFENEKIWFLDERKEPLWKKYANLPQCFPLKRMRAGSQFHNANSS